MRAALADELATLDGMSRAELGHRWVALTGRPAPKLSRAMLRLAVAYELQARALGGLSRHNAKVLEGRMEPTAASALRPGTRLARAHNGTMHVVTIGADGEVEWNGRSWRSLSEVARVITGTRWSGPAFFGLKDKRKVAA